MSDLSLPHGLGERLVTEARATPDIEICGFLARGDDGLIRHIITNRSERLADRFDMDPAEQIAAFRRMRERQARLIAIYHSHPVGEAVPSRHDICGHSYPQATALIIAPRALSGPCLRAWRLDAAGAKELELTWHTGAWHDARDAD